MTEIVVDPTMIERVAEAIWMENRPEGAPAYGDLDFLDQGRVKMIARACILEMKKPTDEMLATIEPCQVCGGSIEVWAKMIDAALKED